MRGFGLSTQRCDRAENPVEAPSPPTAATIDRFPVGRAEIGSKICNASVPLSLWPLSLRLDKLAESLNPLL